MQLFNQINARQLNDKLSIFEGISANRVGLLIFVFEVALQVGLTQFAGAIFNVSPRVPRQLMGRVSPGLSGSCAPASLWARGSSAKSSVALIFPRLRPVPSPPAIFLVLQLISRVHRRKSRRAGRYAS